MSNTKFLELVEANIPIVSARIEGEVDIEGLLKALAPGVKFVSINDLSALSEILKSSPEATVLYTTVYDMNVEAGTIKPDKVWLKLLTKKRTLLLVNFPETLPQKIQDDWRSFGTDVGRLLPPDSYIAGMLQEGTNVAEVVPMLRGLTTKAIAEVLMMCGQYGGVTPRTVRKMRGFVTTTPMGVENLSTETACYLPSPLLVQLGEEIVGFVGESHAPVLVPKGVLLDGDPGTGKTEAARYLARQVKLPLYRLDMGSALSKYHGESERQLRDALSFLDENAPCVVLFDEVEKVLKVSTSDDEGAVISNRLLSMLLWWLEEKPAGIYVVMTTNDYASIPEELVREGRIDIRLTLEHFATELAAYEFLVGLEHGLIAALGLPGVDEMELKNMVILTQGSWTPSVLKSALLDEVRRLIRGGNYVFDGEKYVQK